MVRLFRDRCAEGIRNLLRDLRAQDEPATVFGPGPRSRA